ncbi:MAG TPA: Gfo/Idh/MocA family oxidoreductase [Flavilitoribacter sp.]|nr:Gfo/Idh/MocA family oxidoreductase [Flavilitoribacter sp.]HMQ87626.1 Gfo/Idh/MocA family oxidoreductase [Flavilitoribacter sp.]
MKIGILGLGEGRSTISAALASPLVELKTICDINRDLCLHRAREFGFEHFTTDYNDLLTDPEIDLIAIYTPDFLHAEHVKQALMHGKHVICTKPFIDDLKYAKDLIDAQQKSGKHVFVGQSSRFFEPMKRQRSDYEQGLIGELITVESHYNADHRWFLGKGWSLDKRFKWLYGGLSHPVDFIRWYLPNVEEVMGYGMLSPNGRAGGLKNHDTMHFIFKAEDGRSARVSGTYSSPVQPGVRDSEMSCILRGAEGCSQGDYPLLRYAITDRTGEEKMITFTARENHYFRFEGHSHHAGEYQNYLEYFVACIQNGEIAYPDLKEGIGTIALLKAMERSLETGKPVRIREILNEYDL